jgi:hypothetical protein
MVPTLGVFNGAHFGGSLIVSTLGVFNCVHFGGVLH